MWYDIDSCMTNMRRDEKKMMKVKKAVDNDKKCDRLLEEFRKVEA